MTHRRRSDWLLALIVFVSLSALGHHKFGTLDAIQRLAVTRAMFHEHTVVTTEFGAVKYGPLQPVLMLPPYALGFATGTLLRDGDPRQVGYRIVAFLFTPLLVTAIFFRYLRLVRRLGGEPALALASAFLLVWGTLLLPYSRLLFSEPLNALLILLTFEAVLSIGLDGAARIWPVFFWLALLVLNNAIFAALYGLVAAAVVLRCLRDSRAAAARALGASLLFGLASAGFWALYNNARFGAPFDFGYGGYGFGAFVPEGLYALTLSVGRGIVLYSPLTVLSFLFFVIAARGPAFERCRWALAVFWIAAALFLGLYSAWDVYEGGWCWGPRFLLPFVPVLHVAFPFALAAASKAGRGAKVLIGAAITGGIAVNAWEFLGAYQDFETATFKSGAVPYRWSVFLPEYASILHNWSAGAARSRLPQFFAVGAISWALLRFTARRGVPRGA